MLSVVIPVCNEQENIGKCVTDVKEALSRHGYTFEIIVVDDGSRDHTFAVGNELAREMPCLRVLRHARNLGIGAAIRTGVSAVNGAIVVVVDADLSYSVDCLLRIVRQVQTCDVVTCSPYLRGIATQGIDPLRLFASRAVNVMYRIVIGGRLTCYTSMVRAYKTDALRSVDWNSKGFESQAEILANLLRSGWRIVEVPATLQRRAVGASKFNILREFVRHLRLVLHLIATMKSSRSMNGTCLD